MVQKYIFIKELRKHGVVRLYYPSQLKKDNTVVLQADHTHYIQRVLRLGIGEKIALFNGEEGEWQATITTVSKKNISVTLNECIKSLSTLPKVHLIFSLLKQDALYYLIEKATELGVTNFHPVLTDRCHRGRFNREKWIKNSIEACQQCERLAPPTFSELIPLKEFFQKWSSSIPILCALERTFTFSIGTALKTFSPFQEIGFLIGPEGGFSSDEAQLIKSFSYIKTVSLGPRILRAETAALASLTCFQALLGDWEPPVI